MGPWAQNRMTEGACGRLLSCSNIKWLVYVGIVLFKMWGLLQDRIILFLISVFRWFCTDNDNDNEDFNDNGGNDDNDDIFTVGLMASGRVLGAS